MRIPKTFKLYGQTFTVEYNPALSHNDDVHGWARYRENKIVLQPSTPSTPITQEFLEHTFFHELMHHILYLSGEDQYDPPLHKQECFVDRIAGLLHQAMTTAEYDPTD